jgi:hypothetical protein
MIDFINIMEANGANIAITTPNTTNNAMHINKAME